MSEQVDMVEVKTEPNESGKLYSVCKISNVIVNNHLRQHKVTYDYKNHSSFRLL